MFYIGALSITSKFVSMFFGLFGKKENNSFHKKFTNVIYATELAKQKGIIQFAKANSDAIFIAWFTNTALHYRKQFLANNINEDRIVEAKSFSAAKYSTAKIIFLEHFPLRTKEDALVQNCMQEEFVFYNALTEPIFAYFGSDRIIDLMSKMGYKDDETIQHKMIDKSLLRAQEKIAERVQFETNTSASQSEWMLVNVGSEK
jgi:hypothetical protein